LCYTDDMSETLLRDLPLEKGAPVSNLVKLQNFELKNNKSGGKQFLIFEARDKSATVPCKKWDSSPQELERFSKLSVAFLTGKVDLYKDTVSIVADTIAAPEEEVVESFLKEHEVLNEAAASPLPMPTKIEHLKDIPHEKDVPVEVVVRISNLEYKTTKKDGTGCKPYLMFSLSDKETDFRWCKKWDSSQDEFEALKKVKVVSVRGKSDIHNNTLGIVAEVITPVSPEDEARLLKELVPSSNYDILTMKKGIWNLIQKMENPWIKKLCEAFLKDPVIKEKFHLVPGARGMHHAFSGGLMEHVYRLMLLANDFVDSYNNHSWPGNKVIVDKDAVLAMVFFHDLYKVQEYTESGEYAVEGNKLGHISRCIMEIGSKTAQIDGFPADIKELIVHGVSSHHGQLEWGSPDTPACPEALICHYLDNLSSKLDPTIAALNKVMENRWTEKPVKTLNKPAFLGNCRIKDRTPGETQ